MHEIASGVPVTCLRGRRDDYQCKHDSFLIGLRRFASQEDVLFRAEPLFEDDEPYGAHGRQIGFVVQFFWDRSRSAGDVLPDGFIHPEPEQTEIPDLSPYVRDKYAAIPPTSRAPVVLK